MESIINSKIIDFLNVQQVLSDKQFGFRKNKSCTQQLLSCRNVWTSQLDQGECLDVVYIDFSKAFDSVSHEKLLYKLSNYGLGEKLRTWISCFLTNRIQMVKINDELSRSLKVTSGVPQGSILGPTLFLL